MQKLAISDLSFCELPGEKNLDKITGGQTSVSVHAVSVSRYDPQSSSSYAWVEAGINFSSPQPVISWNNFKLRKLSIKKFNNIKRIKPVSGIKFQV